MTAVVAAAGSGERLGAGGPKAFVPVAGRPLLEWSLAALATSPSVGAIVVAVPPGAATGGCRSSLLHGKGTATSGGGVGLELVEGGATRADSVANALAAVETDLVAIHDAARPLLTPELLEGVVATLLADPEAQGVIAAAPVADTLKRAATLAAFDSLSPSKAASVAETVARDGLWAAQTPQVFRADALREALAAAGSRAVEATDEAMPLEWAGGRVLLHRSPGPNPKLTTPADLRLIEALLRDRESEAG